MWHGWLRYGGVDLSYEERTRAYIANGLAPRGFSRGAPACSTLVDLLGDGFETPAIDRAPWFDDLTPESGLFAGMLIRGVEGLEQVVADRSVTQNQAGGGTLGPLVHGAKPITVYGTLVARHHAGIQLGKQHIASILDGSADVSGVVDGLGTLEFYDACPPPAIEICKSPNLTARVAYSAPATGFPMGHGCGCGGWTVSPYRAGLDGLQALDSYWLDVDDLAVGDSVWTPRNDGGIADPADTTVPKITMGASGYAEAIGDTPEVEIDVGSTIEWHGTIGEFSATTLTMVWIGEVSAADPRMFLRMDNGGSNRIFVGLTDNTGSAEYPVASGLAYTAGQELVLRITVGASDLTIEASTDGGDSFSTIGTPAHTLSLPITIPGSADASSPRNQLGVSAASTPTVQRFTVNDVDWFNAADHLEPELRHTGSGLPGVSWALRDGAAAQGPTQGRTIISGNTRVLPWDNDHYIDNPGGVGNNVRIAPAATISASQSIAVEADIEIRGANEAGTATRPLSGAGAMIDTDSGDAKSIRFRYNDGTGWNNSGYVDLVADLGLGGFGTRARIRGEIDTDAGTVDVYTTTDFDSRLEDVDWGAIVHTDSGVMTTGTRSASPSSTTIDVMGRPGDYAVNGKFYRARVLDLENDNVDLDVWPNRDIDATSDPSTGQLSWVDEAGLVATVNRPSSGKRLSVVTSPRLAFDEGHEGVMLPAALTPDWDAGLTVLLGRAQVHESQPDSFPRLWSAAIASSDGVALSADPAAEEIDLRVDGTPDNRTVSMPLTEIHTIAATGDGLDFAVQLEGGTNEAATDAGPTVNAGPITVGADAFDGGREAVMELSSVAVLPRAVEDELDDLLEAVEYVRHRGDYLFCESCTTGDDLTRVIYPVFPELAAGAQTTDFVTGFTSAKRVNGTSYSYGDRPPPGLPDLGWADHPAAAGSPARVQARAYSSGFQRDVVAQTIDPATSGPVVGGLEVSFRLAGGSGNIGLALWDEAADRFLPVTSVAGVDQAAYTRHSDKVQIYSGSSSARAGTWRVAFNADGYEPGDLQVLWWALNPVPEEITEIQVAWSGQGSEVLHGGGSSQWVVDAVNVDPDPADTPWASPAALAAWMTANDPNGYTWVLSANAAQIVAVVDTTDATDYGNLAGQGSETSDPTTVAIVGESVCPVLSNIDEWAAWMTANDPNGNAWGRWGVAGVAASVEVGDETDYGGFAVCGTDGGLLTTLEPTRTLDDGTIDLTVEPGRLYRAVRQVGLLSGLRETGRRGRPGEITVADIEFDLLAEIPYIYGQLQWITYRQVFDGIARSPIDVECPPGSAFDPSCFPAPTETTDIAVDTCYELPASTWQACASIFNSDRSRSGTTVIDVEAGAESLTNFRITAYRRQSGEPACPGCGADADLTFYECDRLLAKIEIPELPAGSRLTIDGRDRLAVLELVDGTRLAGGRFFTGAEGAPSAWVDLPPGDEVCFVAEADTAGTAADATVSIGFVPRWLIG